MKYDCVIFDLDGTLLNTLEDLCASVNFALRAHGMPERSLSEVRTFVGNGIRNLIASSVADGSGDDVTNCVLETFKTYYKDHSQDKTKPYDGIIDLLFSIKEKGITTAVVSNKVDFAVQKLVGDYFPGLVDVAVGELEGVKRKPDPDTVFIAMKKLSAKKCLYVGDSEVDVKTAKNAGIDGAFVTWGFRSEDELRLAGGECIVHTVGELSEVIL